MTPKFISPADPAARWTGAHGGQAFFAYSANYLIDLDHAVIVDVEAAPPSSHSRARTTSTPERRRIRRFGREPLREDARRSAAFSLEALRTGSPSAL